MVCIVYSVFAVAFSILMLGYNTNKKVSLLYNGFNSFNSFRLHWIEDNMTETSVSINMFIPTGNHLMS